MYAIPVPVQRALKKLGSDLKNARKRRRLPMKLTAERAMISRSTLNKIENGDGGVSLAAYAKVLFVLGLITKLADLADIKFDELGLSLEGEQLPQRVRFSKKDI